MELNNQKVAFDVECGKMTVKTARSCKIIEQFLLSINDHDGFVFSLQYFFSSIYVIM